VDHRLELIVAVTRVVGLAAVIAVDLPPVEDIAVDLPAADLVAVPPAAVPHLQAVDILLLDTVAGNVLHPVSQPTPLTVGGSERSLLPSFLLIVFPRAAQDALPLKQVFSPGPVF